jgi:DNA-binding response OmpR family regulator
MISTILIVEDEQDICEILKFNLKSKNFSVDIANSAEEALNFDIKKYALILLDVMMGEMSGYDFARTISKKYGEDCPPIIFLTAKDEEADKLEGFDVGADDYITKPFSLNEVMARVKSVLKRTQKTTSVSQESEIINYEGLEINTETKQVAVDGDKVKLTPKEFEILLLLLKKRGKVYSREVILSKVWQENVYVLDRAVDVNIARLRKKLKDYGQNIISRTGYGYSFQD